MAAVFLGEVQGAVVSVLVTSSLSSFPSEKRFCRDITVAQLKGKLEMITGAPAAGMRLQLFGPHDEPLPELSDDDAQLGSYPVDNGCRIHVMDVTGQQKGEFEDLSSVPKYDMQEDDYEKRSESVRTFMKQRRLGRYDEEMQAQREEERRKREEEEKLAASAITVGQRCEVEVVGQPHKRGTVMFVGQADFKPGFWVGVKYDEPLGKNDGSVGGRRYFECEPRYGAFLKPMSITVGDFPEEDLGLDDEM
ncbi:tubulin-folding cofactor B-like [Lethenteron reissneri]|uniref:tubulin-folding cofactor B-like n=1 Tax=Lethenteron reissneri TaxID=7753 RepID=UPI002AB6B4DA|nr:tubulin-folding cofactor B-like [Lethenteron reissneri]XP_061407165.1 tubulin-folding cofactor B-like [Lethenteron reissneri]XP_061407392.1 tubulin-folding cofactor B-like [Lethenteron reissneri]XP_061407393.1 tubulin-folding cofactor B-like [Lethenteron reissneri]XP_061407394.1 tubulin-folding cofactor B-like [Lethenteron reissneri]